MGNLCISNDCAYDEYRYKKHKCIKCKDMFTLYKNNNRLHCRMHRINKNGICLDCKQYICKDKHSSCRHYKETKWYSLFT